MSKIWYESSGKDSDVVISTRIRLARNLNNYPFPIRMNIKTKNEVVDLVFDALKHTSDAALSHLRFCRLDEISRDELISLVDNRVISPEMISYDIQGKAVVFDENYNISVMINEEDHIRIQTIREGEALKETYELADKIDNLLSEQLEIAFDEQLGYLTQCPTNLGTGMRCSLMLHLPALMETGEITRITSNLSKLGITVRGSHGEGSKVEGAYFQISNQISLGLSESEAIANLSALSAQIIEKERNCRKGLLNNISFEDKVFRALGALKFSRQLSYDEFIDKISYVRLAVAEGKISGIELKDVDFLMSHVKLFDTDRDTSLTLRADMVRKGLEAAK